MKRYLAVLSAVCATAGAILLLWPEQQPASAAAAKDTPAALAYQRAAANPAFPPAWPGTVPLEHAPPEQERVPLLPVDMRLSATQSLATTRENGDTRTPPLAPSSDQLATPTPEQLADPKAYHQFELEQHARTLAAYAIAADSKIPQLRADIERGRAAGISPAQLAKQEEKLRRLEALRSTLRQTDAGPNPDGAKDGTGNGATTHAATSSTR